MSLDPNDLVIDLLNSGGAGGQHVGCTRHDMVILDKKTEIVVTIPGHLTRSQHHQRELGVSMMEWARVELGIET